MLLQTAPQNEAILSNVGEVGDFKIKASAKAFSILSSGLYANKIRAIVRELSCNAVDSHTAADKSETPFDVHLPNQLEPWFAIRDYGTGLSHEQVTQIYTTYFESTKTDSNDYIGALGLGSKSPFSYTDNFTVTAIQNGTKGIYTAFINGQGVPSIALMMSEATTEPNGVEVKFSVNDRWEFSKFADEARSVYKWFKLQPVVSGVNDFTIQEVVYETKDIIPGVHSTERGRCTAVMGNISYPIDVPQATLKDFGDVAGLLNCGLIMEFAIGELDFQASREGLSYIPTTIDAIKNKLTQVNGALTKVLADEADKIENLWDRALFLYKKKDSGLWSSAVTKYVADTKLATWNHDTNAWNKLMMWKPEVSELASKYNMDIRCFTKGRGSNTCSNVKVEIDYDRSKRDSYGNYISRTVRPISVASEVFFVINDGKIGATERAKYHFRETKWEDGKAPYSATVYVIEPADKTKPVKTKAFFDAICNPTGIMNASDLLEKPRKESGLGKNVTIMALQKRNQGGYYRQEEMVWRDAGKASDFDDSTTYYYLPLSGFAVQSKFQSGSFEVKQFYNDLKDCGVTGLQHTIYGVRKGDIEFIQTKQNWVNIEDHISASLKVVDHKLMMSLALQAIDSFNLLSYNSNIVAQVNDKTSPYLALVNQFIGFEKIRYSENSLKRLCNRYAPGVNFSPEAFVQKFVDEASAVSKRYPLLAYLRSAPNAEVAEYINLIDTQKGV